MNNNSLTIRAFFQLDGLQPKFAAYNGATVQGSIPMAGDSVLVGEMAPGNEVFRLVDVALKASSVEATSQIVEREFGFFILRSRVPSEITVARESILGYLGMSLYDRIKPQIESVQRINSVEPYQAQLLNKWRRGSMVVPGETLGILECAPAAYIAIGANTAEKAALISMVQVRAVGRYGRLFISGSEENVVTALDAAVEAVEAVEGR